jgi:DNA polymerase-3 subunit gamma/tau
MSDSEEMPGFNLGTPPQPERAGAYRVLARKYRPQKFSQLIGQDAMVQTLGNAIRRDRLAHAFLMTGVRGVGKTSTARLIAKALNCIGEDGQGGPTIDPCGTCSYCVSIAEGRCIDVLEMDAASNTKVEQMRELLDNVPYASVGARYKIYIIDEVHMLSNSSFNALLKTLEEPPPHVKFLFATTEVQKVPVTVLSRCQRFDLRRISAAQLATHFGAVAHAEGVAVEDEALELIARASEGSARDGLSILDQAIAHAGEDGDGRVTANQVRNMLGLSDRNAIRDVFDGLLKGDATGVLKGLRDQFDLGVDPAAVFKALLEQCHGTTLQKIGGQNDVGLSAEDRAAFETWSDGLSFQLLHRLWQLLLKGHAEVQQASDQRMAAEMAALRVVHASQLPDPGDLARQLTSGGGAVRVAGVAGVTASAPAAPQQPTSFEDLVAALETSGKHVIGDQLRREFGLIRFGPGELVIRPLRPQADANYIAKLNAAVRDVLGGHWRIEVGEAEAGPSLADQEATAEAAMRESVLNHPIVRAATEAFPEAELTGIESSQGGFA